MDHLPQHAKEETRRSGLTGPKADFNFLFQPWCDLEFLNLLRAQFPSLYNGLWIKLIFQYPFRSHTSWFYDLTSA